MKQLKKKRKSAAARDGDTEQRILEAAHEVFVRRGLPGVTSQQSGCRSLGLGDLLELGDAQDEQNHRPDRTE